jgi:methylenetetrahydrofolate reductase (NADPH)
MSRLEQRIRVGELVLTAELLTVDTGGVDAVHERFAPFEEYVDAVNATDHTAAHAHASALSVAIALLRLGMEPVMQVACRDRNRIAIEADIVGAALHGVENLCCMTGDDVTAGDEPEARRVFDLDSPQLIATAATLASGRYLSGRPLEPAPHLFIGSVENPGAPPYEERVERALKKVRAGASFIQLQLCFDTARLERFMAVATAQGLVSQAALIPSICLVRSPSALRFVAEKVPGISVPPELIERCERAADPEEECFQLGVELAAHALAQPGVAGLHLISFRREAGIARLCQELGIPTRKEREASGYRSAVAI